MRKRGNELDSHDPPLGETIQEQRHSRLNVGALVTVDKDDLDDLIGQLPAYLMQEVDQGLRQALAA